jgi:ATP-binding cassette subfamily B protein
MSGWVSMTAMTIFTNVGEIEDGMRTLSPPHAIVDAEGAVAPASARGDVRFEDVRFGYGRPTAALDGLTLHVRPGERVALVGRSGAGKTTAVSLLLRLYEVEGGRILLDGVDIRELTQDALRAQIGMVRQETAMFNRSAVENIRYGKPDASEEQVHEAARRAEAHDFILGLRDWKGRTGYAAHLGERGVKLSGGQRQRIALARVILKDAPVLVLDEATSSLDSEVEAAIQDTLDTIMEGKTVIAIAHRLSTIARMDRIVVLDAGRIVEEGTHAALLARRGLYARFWERQSGGFINLAAE